MRRLVALLILLATLPPTVSYAAERFNRPVIEVADPSRYKFHDIDQIQVPSLENDSIEVSCVVYRGTQRYYVEIAIFNRTVRDIPVSTDFVAFRKPGYTVLQTSTLETARVIAAEANGTFVPTPPPQAPTRATINGTASTYGGQTQISGSTTTGPDPWAQAGANLGNAIGNGIAARQYYAGQAQERTFAHFLEATAAESMAPLVRSGESRTITQTFEQLKSKKAPFEIVVSLAGSTFAFTFKE